MTRRRGNPERSRITHDGEKHRTDMQEKKDQIERTTADAETERQTLDHIEGGTQEGFDEVTQNIEAAQDVSVSEFDGQSQELDQIHAEAESHEQEIREYAQAAGSDMDRISDAGGRVHSDAVRSELDRARSAAESDIAFLDEHEQRAQEARAESQRHRDEYRSRVDAARSA